MHQHPRPSPRSASSASNPSTNPERTNNPREGPPHRTRSSVDLASYTEKNAGGSEPSRTAEGSAAAAQEKETTRLNQIIQHFHTKAALMICSARAGLPQVRSRDGTVKQDRWFNLVLDDTDVLYDDLLEWKRPDLSSNKPATLTVDVYVDARSLSPNQALVVTDDDGKRWDISDALVSSSEKGRKTSELVVERWVIRLDGSDPTLVAKSDEQLPNVYKKGVVLFRSLYSYLRLLPAWKLYRRLGRHSGNNGGLRLKYRVRQGSDQASLELPPLFPSRNSSNTSSDDDSSFTHAGRSPDDARVANLYHFEPLITPAGACRISCRHLDLRDLAVADREASLSSLFLGLDQGLPALQGGRSLPGAASSHRERQSTPPKAAPREPRALLGTYGSLGTFHNTISKRGSPISALKRRDSGEESDMDRIDEIRYEAGASVWDVHGRRPVITAGEWEEMKKGPFKGGSLGSSPQQGSRASSSRRDSQKRTSLNTLPQKALRAPPASLPNETAIASSGSSSPMVPPGMPRYSSAFPGRPKRSSSNTQHNQAAESGGSSARGSGSEQAASGTRSDEDDIANFIRTLESDAVKQAKISKPAPRHTVDLSKYSALREPSSQLADDMSASSLLNQGSTPPSRRLSNVPALSTSSSPRPSHVPHVRSRLSTQSIAEEAAHSHDDEGSDEEPLLFATEGV